jgi:hypothetical protein
MVGVHNALMSAAEDAFGRIGAYYRAHARSGACHSHAYRTPHHSRRLHHMRETHESRLLLGPNERRRVTHDLPETNAPAVPRVGRGTWTGLRKESPARAARRSDEPPVGAVMGESAG